VLYLRNYLKGGGSVGVTGRSSGSGAARGGAITGGEPRDGEAMVFGAASSVRRSEAVGGASLGEVAAAPEPGVEALVAPGARVSSGETPVRRFVGGEVADEGADSGTEEDGDEGGEEGAPADAPASVAGTNASADGDHTYPCWAWPAREAFAELRASEALG